jgi:hypothetical protein
MIAHLLPALVLLPSRVDQYIIGARDQRAIRTADRRLEGSVEKKRSVDVSFTDFLYALFAGSSFQYFFPFKWGWEDSILLASFIVLVDDWVLYHAQTSNIGTTSRNFAKLLLCDVVVLMVWYTMARSGGAETNQLRWFVWLLSGFYLVIAIAEWLFLSETKEPILLLCDLFCFLYLSISATLLLRTNQLNHQWMIPIVLVPLIPPRALAWKRLIFKSQ